MGPISYSSVKQTSATVNFGINKHRAVRSSIAQAQDQNYPKSRSIITGNDKNGTETIISYKDMTWNWSFSDGSSSNEKNPAHTFTGLTAGASNTVEGILTVKCTETTTKTSWSTDAEGVKTITEPSISNSVVTLSSESDSSTVYTQPDAWSFDCYSGAYISDYITATKWNQFVDQIGKYKSWETQSDKYSSYNYLKVSRGDWITASLYNQAANICGTSTVKANNTIISAALFKALADAVSP